MLSFNALRKLIDALIWFLLGGSLFGHLVLLTCKVPTIYMEAQSVSTVGLAVLLFALTQLSLFIAPARPVRGLAMDLFWGCLGGLCFVGFLGSFQALESSRLAILTLAQAVPLLLAGWGLSRWLSFPGRPWKLMSLMGALAILEDVLLLLQHFHFPFASLSAIFSGWVPITVFFWLLGQEVLPYGTFGNVNFAAEAMVLFVPMLVALALRAKGRLRFLWGAAALISVALLLASGARGALLGLLVGAFWIGFAERERIGRALRARYVMHPRLMRLAGIVVAVGGGLLFWGAFLPKLAGGYLAGGSTELRLAGWNACLAMWREHPFLGIGWGNFPLAVGAYLPSLYPESVPSFLMHGMLLQAHSEPLQLLAETGILGVVLVLLGIACLWKALRQAPLEPLGWVVRAGLSGILVASFFEFPFQVPLTAWLTLLLLAVGTLRATEESASSPRSGVSFALGEATALALGAMLWFVLVPTWHWDSDYLLAEALAREGKFKLAGDMLELAERAAYFQVYPRQDRLLILQHEGQFDEIEALIPSSAALSLPFASHLIEASALEHLGKREAAIEIYSRLARAFPAGTDVRMQAEKALESLLQHAPSR